jgi:hypothetical protein
MRDTPTEPIVTCDEAGGLDQVSGGEGSVVGPSISPHTIDIQWLFISHPTVCWTFPWRLIESRDSKIQISVEPQVQIALRWAKENPPRQSRAGKSGVSENSGAKQADEATPPVVVGGVVAAVAGSHQATL